MIMLLKNVACIYAKIQIIAHKENEKKLFPSFFYQQGAVDKFLCFAIE